MKSKPLVTVICITYNQEDYIRETLNSLISQKTDFAFEILVHDDASSDSTPKIIMEFYAQYPHLIKPVLEKENKLSIATDFDKEYLLPYAEGEYVAICEGDDFWCDETKLQKQMDILLNNSEYSACVHDAWRMDCDTGVKTRFSERTEDGVIPIEDIIMWGRKCYPTVSLVAKKELYDLPQGTIVHDGVSDYLHGIYMALRGPIFYIDECMAVYRYKAKGSWTVSSHSQLERLEKHVRSKVLSAEDADIYSQREYHELFAIAQKNFLTEYVRIEMQHRQPMKKYKEEWRQIGFMNRIKVVINVFFPFIIPFIHIIQGRKNSKG